MRRGRHPRPTWSTRPTEYREQLIETIATEDEELMEKYLGGEDVTEDELKAAIRKGTLNNDVRADPVRVGVQEQGCPADARRRHRLPAVPARRRRRSRARHSRAARRSTRGPTTRAFSALAFKIVADPFGKLTYFRVYSGEINKGGEVYNSTKEKRERLGRILLMHANQREDLDVAMAGDIVAGLGFKDVTHRRHALRPRRTS